MYQINETVIIEDDDQCLHCKHFQSGVACPLLHALGVHVASLNGDFIISNCGFFTEFKRNLKLVK